MDRSLISQIVSYSREMEIGLQRSQSDVIAALSELQSLDALTEQNLAQPQAQPAKELPPAAPVQVQVQAPAPVAPKPARANTTQYNTTNREYAPALSRSESQDDLIRALLEFQRKKGIRPQGSSIIPGKRTQDAASSQGFAPMSLPEIDVVPKDNPLGSPRSPGVRVPVFRPKTT